MKVAVITLAALAASASASALRVLTSFDGESPLPPVEVVAVAASALHPSSTGPSAKQHSPCHGHRQPSSRFPGPLGSLLASLGFAPRSRKHDEHWAMIHSAVEHHQHQPSGDEHEAQMDGLENWRHRIESMLHDKEGQGIRPLEVLPGMFKEHKGDKVVVTYRDANGNPIEPSVIMHEHKEHNKHGWSALEGKNGVKKHHHKHHEHHYAKHHGHHGHRHHKSFGGRLHHALRHLTPSEAITMAFVMGAGIGSILHFVFMLFLLGARRWRCSPQEREERRAIRKANKAARKAERAERKAARKADRAERKALKHGAIKLEGEDVLPGYAESEAREVIEEKA